MWPAIPLRAVALYCEASRQGDAEAQFSLGWMYANGRGMPRDNRMASLFFGLAAEQGHEYARKMRAFVGPAAADPPDCLRDPAPPPQEEAAEFLEPDDDFVAATPEQKKAAEVVAQARSRIQGQPAASRSPSSAPSPISIRMRARPRTRRA